MAGLARLNEFIKYTQVLNDELSSGRAVQSFVERNEDWIVSCVASKQLYAKGQNALGVDIMSYRPYTPFTVQMKEEKGQPTDRVTLRDTGDFYDSMRVDADKTYFEIVADDWKTEQLKGKYGDDILGLNADNKGQLIWDKLYPDLLQYAKGLIFGGDNDLPM